MNKAGRTRMNVGIMSGNGMMMEMMCMCSRGSRV